MKIRVYFIAASVALLTLLVYLPALNNGFVGWDDNVYVYENPHIRSLNPDFFKWIFQFYAGNWHPLTLLSHGLDYLIWGLNPMGHHLSSIMLHAINTFLLSLLVSFLIMGFKPDESSDAGTAGQLFRRAVIAGGITALLFGIHPVHVESVAWISERKDVLSTFFVLLAIISYGKYVVRHEAGNGSSSFYAASLVCFVLALMSKPMAVTLPVILVILDIYPLQRFSLKEGVRSQRRVLIEKIPFFFLSMISAVVTVIAQESGGAIQSLEYYPLSHRILVATKALFFYLEKIVLPINLSPFYPYPHDVAFLSPKYLIPLILVLLINGFCIWALEKGKKIFPAAWLFYVVTLLPVLGIIQIGGQGAADRYTYIPSIGPFLLIGLGTAVFVEKMKGTSATGRVIFPLIPALFVCLLGLMTVKQIKVWKDGITLWSRAIEVEPGRAGIAYVNRGALYGLEGRYEESLKDLNSAININPAVAQPYYNRGTTYFNLGRYEEALRDYTQAVALDHRLHEVYYNRGNVYLKLGQYREALDDYTRAIELSPAPVFHYYNNRGIAYEKLGLREEALKDFYRADSIK